MQEAQAATVSGAASAVGEGLPPPEGLWGSRAGRRAGSRDQRLDVGENWRASFNTEEETTGTSTYALMAGTNILVYALTRKSGITPHLPPPTWMPGQRPVAAVQESPLAVEVAAADECCSTI